MCIALNCVSSRYRPDIVYFKDVSIKVQIRCLRQRNFAVYILENDKNIKELIKIANDINLFMFAKILHELFIYLIINAGSPMDAALILCISE